MIDLTHTLNSQKGFRELWDDIVGELLLNFEDGCTYNYDTIKGNRPYNVDLTITIYPPCNEDDYQELNELKREHDDLMNRLDNYFRKVESLLENSNVDDPIIILEKSMEYVEKELKI